MTAKKESQFTKTLDKGVVKGHKDLEDGGGLKPLVTEGSDGSFFDKLAAGTVGDDNPKKKPTTFYMEPDLTKIVNKLTKKKKGLKTDLINECIRYTLTAYGYLEDPKKKEKAKEEVKEKE